EEPQLSQYVLPSRPADCPFSCEPRVDKCTRNWPRSLGDSKARQPGRIADERALVIYDRGRGPCLCLLAAVLTVLWYPLHDGECWAPRRCTYNNPAPVAPRRTCRHRL